MVKLIAHVGKLSENVHCLAHIPTQHLQIELVATGKITFHVIQVPIENTVFTALCLINIWLHFPCLSNFSYMNLHCITASQRWMGSWFPLAACHRTYQAQEWLQAFLCAFTLYLTAKVASRSLSTSTFWYPSFTSQTRPFLLLNALWVFPLHTIPSALTLSLPIITLCLSCLTHLLVP